MIRKIYSFHVFVCVKHCRCISWTTPAVPGRSATGHVAAALLTSSPQTSPAPRATSSWSGTTAERATTSQTHGLHTVNAVKAVKAVKLSLCISVIVSLLSVRHVSFVDCPGHDILMATMLNGAAVMDAALLLIGKSDSFTSTRKQPFTSLHSRLLPVCS